MTTTVLTVWVFSGLIAGMHRPRMVWQEENKNYRVFLAIAFAPTWFVVNLAVAVFLSVMQTIRGLHLTIEGKDPSVEASE